MMKIQHLGLAFFMRAALLFCCVLVAACRDAPTASGQPSFGDDNIQILGRYAARDDGVQMAWPGAGITVRFEGRTLSLTIEDDGRGMMDVHINGQEVAPLMLKSGTHNYTIVSAETASVYDVTVTRRTEVFDTGTFTIKGVQMEGESLPPPSASSDRKMLFLGDSITAGFGVRGDTKTCQYAPETNAPLLSYGGLTAKTLGARAHYIAISGRGVVYNWDDNPMPVMPAQIDLALADHPDGPRWDHSAFQPDIVVTLLGTNDWSVIDPGRNKFRTGYRDMLAGLRARFPDAHIVTVSGPLLGGAQGAAIRDGIDWAMDALDDPHISTLDLSLSNTGLVWSCNSHPGRDSMAKMARELSTHITARTPWELAGPLPDIAPSDLPPDGAAHFKKRVAEIDAAPLTDGGVMLIGDSITEAWLWQDGVFPADVVTNHGVGWDNTGGVLARLPQMTRHNPDQIFIKIGTNDISQGVPKAEIVANVDTLLSKLKAVFPQAEIYMQSILPRESDKRDIIAQINADYREMVQKHGVDWVDLTPLFAAPDGTLLPELTDDGLHLRAEGYRIWADHLAQYTR